MTLDDFLYLAKQYVDLGWSVQQQLQDVMDGDALDEQNPNALDLIRRFLVTADGVGIEDEVDLRGQIEDHLVESGFQLV